MSIRTRSTAVTAVLSLLLAASMAAGCGGEAAPTPADPSAAKEFLTRALDAWKEGKPKDSLTKGSPSLLVNDPDWERKSKLTAYTIEGDPQPLGAGVKWSVPLTLSARGKTLDKKAEYAVNIAEGLVSISRIDLDL
ncbi:hypothetical protein [Paludisphaera sp.]|uniref:hypothetical protein n=1 Tax=Paludisphaera sp. TaxID=2017432 RepID=UPI00301D8E9F